MKYAASYAQKAARFIAPVSIRRQLLIFYSVVFTLLFFLLSGVTFGAISHNIEHSVYLQSNAQLAGPIQQLQAQLSVSGSTLQLGGLTHVAANNPALYFRVIDTSQKILYQTANFSHLNIPFSAVDYAQNGIEWDGAVRILSAGPSDMADLHSIPLIFNKKHYGVLLVALPMNNFARQTILISLGLIGLSIAAGILLGYIFVDRAFHPIRRMIHLARAIKNGDLSQRVPEPKAKDEVYELAVTFNEMLDSINANFQLQKQFSADASHELRTPVSIIRAMTDESIIGSPTIEESREIIRNVHAESIRMSALIQDLLLLAQSDDYKLKLELEMIAADELILDIADVMQPLAAEHVVTLTVETIPVKLFADRSRITQVIVGLIDNAMKYSRQNGKITLSVSEQDDAAVIVVADNGVGISDKDLPHIFDRFYRAKHARTRTDNATGLGLAIAKAMILAQNGSIQAESQFGVGSRFTIFLPKMKQHEQ